MLVPSHSWVDWWEAEEEKSDGILPQWGTYKFWAYGTTTTPHTHTQPSCFLNNMIVMNLLMNKKLYKLLERIMIASLTTAVIVTSLMSSLWKKSAQLFYEDEGEDRLRTQPNKGRHISL